MNINSDIDTYLMNRTYYQTIGKLQLKNCIFNFPYKKQCQYPRIFNDKVETFITISQNLDIVKNI